MSFVLDCILQAVISSFAQYFTWRFMPEAFSLTHLASTNVWKRSRFGELNPTGERVMEIFRTAERIEYFEAHLVLR